MRRSLYRILFTSDLHGNTLVFRKFLNAILTYKANVGIVGGDLTGKMLIPIIENGPNTYEAELFGNMFKARNNSELQKLMDRIESTGSYYRVLSKEEHEDILSDPVKQDRIFKEEIVNRMKGWLERGDVFVKKNKIPLYLMPGNDDFYDIDELFNNSIVVNPDKRVIQLTNEHEMIACGHSNVTPWNCPRDLEEDKLEEILENLVAQTRDPSQLITVIHVPPYNTKIDLAPALTKDLKYVTKGGTVLMEHVGSTAVRKIIEKHQPLLGLHGHIHESRGFDKIGKTMVFNPGSEYVEGVFHGVLVTVEKDKIRGYMLVSG